MRGPRAPANGDAHGKAPVSADGLVLGCFLSQWNVNESTYSAALTTSHTMRVYAPGTHLAFTSLPCFTSPGTQLWVPRTPPSHNVPDPPSASRPGARIQLCSHAVPSAPGTPTSPAPHPIPLPRAPPPHPLPVPSPPLRAPPPCGSGWLPTQVLTGPLALLLSPDPLTCLHPSHQQTLHLSLCSVTLLHTIPFVTPRTHSGASSHHPPGNSCHLGLPAGISTRNSPLGNS